MKLISFRRFAFASLVVTWGALSYNCVDAKELRHNLRTSSAANDESNRHLLNIFGISLGDFINGALLIGDTSDYVIQTITSNIFSIDGKQLDATQFEKVNLRNDKPLSESRIFKGVVSDGDIIVRKDQSGNIEHVSKVKSTTGERFFLERIHDNDFIEYSSNDIDESRLDDFILDDMPSPTRKLGEEQPEDDLSSSSSSSSSVGLTKRQLQAGCTDITVIRVAVRYSSTFCQDQGNNRDDAEMYLQEVFALINLSYQVSGLCKKLEICNMEGACNDGSNTQYDDIVDSSAVCGGDDNVLDRFINEVIDTQYLNSNQCDLAQFVYGEHTGQGVPGGTVIGCAYRSSLCNRFAGGVNDFQFSNNIDLRATLIAHEAGHNLGSGHDGNDQRGFIMQPSICRCDEFSANSMNQINNYVGSRVSSTCTTTIPADVPPTAVPSEEPSLSPTTSFPSAIPSVTASAMPSFAPSGEPSALPTTSTPSASPSVAASTMPSSVPSEEPSFSPTTSFPSATPSVTVSSLPSSAPSGEPSFSPTTSTPSASPSVTASTLPSATPSALPSFFPTTSSPSASPSIALSSMPSSAPSEQPSFSPTTSFPSAMPSVTASALPSTAPSGQPSFSPTTSFPSSAPTVTASSLPSSAPSKEPSSIPTTSFPSASPSITASVSPSSAPSKLPSSSPTTSFPSSLPTTSFPSAAPSPMPSLQPSIATQSPTAGAPDCENLGLLSCLATSGCSWFLGCYSS